MNNKENIFKGTYDEYKEFYSSYFNFTEVDQPVILLDVCPINSDDPFYDNGIIYEKLGYYNCKENKVVICTNRQDQEGMVLTLIHELGHWMVSKVLTKNNNDVLVECGCLYDGYGPESKEGAFHEFWAEYFTQEFVKANQPQKFDAFTLGLKKSPLIYKFWQVFFKDLKIEVAVNLLALSRKYKKNNFSFFVDCTVTPESKVELDKIILDEKLPLPRYYEEAIDIAKSINELGNSLNHEGVKESEIKKYLESLIRKIESLKDDEPKDNEQKDKEPLLEFVSLGFYFFDLNIKELIKKADYAADIAKDLKLISTTNKS
ncbi:MAG: hypothetical protein IBX55_10670 [Methyloprofundus sp.]|nr:hypothetical protein [Methyloprofundus sp.]